MSADDSFWFSTWPSNQPAPQYTDILMADSRIQAALREVVERGRELAGQRIGGTIAAYAVFDLGGGFAYVPCTVNTYCPPSGVYLLTSDDFRAACDIRGPQFFAASVEAYGEMAARCVAEAHRPEGLGC